MATINREETVSRLKAIGFTEARLKTSDYLYLDFFYLGKLILYIRVALQSEQEISDFGISAMARQCRLLKDDFLDLCHGDMSKEEFVELLQANRDIDLDS